VAEFGYHEETHRITIKLKDKETDKVVKEIPADKTLDMLAKMWEMAGILVDEKR
jgi:flagellar protein FlaG